MAFRLLLNTSCEAVNAYSNRLTYNFQPRSIAFYKASFCTNSPSIDLATFERVSEETLLSLTDSLEDLLEKQKILNESDVAYMTGVLTLNLGSVGTYVINKQAPNRQIWFSSPVSGPKRYNLVNKCWIYKRDGVSLHKCLSKELGLLLKTEVDLTHCYFGSC